MKTLIKQKDLKVGDKILTDFWDYDDTLYIYDGMLDIPEKYKDIAPSEGQFYNARAKAQFDIDGKYYLGSVKFANLTGDFVEVDINTYVYEGLNIDELNKKGDK